MDSDAPGVVEVVRTDPAPPVFPSNRGSHPTACFWMARELRMVLIFLKAWKKSKRVLFVTLEN